MGSALSMRCCLAVSHLTPLQRTLPHSNAFVHTPLTTRLLKPFHPENFAQAIAGLLCCFYGP